MIDQKSVVLGVIISVVLLYGLGYLFSLIGGPITFFSSIIALIVGGIIVGYMVNQDLKTGAMHGALVGVFTAVIVVLILFLLTGGSSSVAGALLILALGYLGVFIILGLIGGISGSIISKRRNFPSD
jgi:hypothetical protein